MREFFKSFLLLLGSTIVAILFAEFLLRMFVPATSFLASYQDAYWLALHNERKDPSIASNIVIDSILGWDSKPEYTTETTIHNQRGYRMPAELSADEKAYIFSVGDSFTYGLGVPTDRTFSALIGQDLGKTVINAGVNAYGIGQSYLKWKTKGRNHRPDYVLLGIYTDDFFRTGLKIRDGYKPYFYLEEGNLNYLTPEQSKEALDIEQTSQIKIINLTKYLMERVKGKFGLITLGEWNHLGSVVASILQTMNQVVKKDGAQLIVLIIAPCFQDPYAPLVENFLEETVRNLSIPYINFHHAMGEDSRSKFCSEKTGHWNELGHRFAADQVVSTFFD